MLPLTADHAPRIGSKMRAMANEIARAGDIAIVGRCAPWSEMSLSHRERFDPDALRSAWPDMPPILLGAHSTVTKQADPSARPTVVGLPTASESIVEGLSIDLYGPGGGFNVCWMVPRDVAAVAALFDNIADGATGLSVEMNVQRESIVWEDWTKGVIRHIHEAVTGAVAMVESPSYMTACIDAMVTPEIVWTHNPRAGTLIPDIEPHLMGALYGIDYQGAMDRAREPATEPTPATVPALTTPEAAAARASAFAQQAGVIEYRRTHGITHGRPHD